MRDRSEAVSRSSRRTPPDPGARTRRDAKAVDGVRRSSHAAAELALMSTSFAMLVTTSESAPPGTAGHLLTGPMIGSLPQSGADLLVRGVNADARVTYVG